MKPHRLAFLFTVALSLPACMERTMIRTYPPNAKVTINDKVVGVTPTVYGMGRWDTWPKKFQCRIEHEGYETLGY